MKSKKYVLVRFSVFIVFQKFPQSFKIRFQRLRRPSQAVIFTYSSSTNPSCFKSSLFFLLTDVKHCANFDHQINYLFLPLKHFFFCFGVNTNLLCKHFYSEDWRWDPNDALVSVTQLTSALFTFYFFFLGFCCFYPCGPLSQIN